jgi:hypothetical protein
LDCSNAHGAYANVCNVSSTREEVVLAFGINNTWERGQTTMQIQMTDRIVLTPYAAKQLATTLNHVIAEYDSTFGPLTHIIYEHFCCNRPSLRAETRPIRCCYLRRSYLVKREAQDRKKVCLIFFVCEIRFTGNDGSSHFATNHHE